MIMPLCMGCLNEIPSSHSKCKNCGFDNNQIQTSPFLPYGSILKSKYVVAKNLDTNGESTTYLGYDNSNGMVVTIREFLPIGLFDREEGEIKLEVLEDRQSDFNKALSDFKSYYSTLASLCENSPMVQIFDIFDANGTCYVIEDHDDLMTFCEYVNNEDGFISWEKARPMMMPVITLLETLHKNDIGHYAISHSNLKVTDDGKLKLYGFSTENERKRGTMLKSQLYSGSAAPEQYKSNAVLGTDTDIYGLTSVLYFALTGNLPSNAKERIEDPRLLIPTNTVKKIPPYVVTALANGLQVRREERIRDFDNLRAQLSVSTPVQNVQDEISRTASMTPIQNEKNGLKGKKSNATVVGIVATIVALLLFSSVGLFWLSMNPLKGIFGSTAETSSTVAVEDGWTGAVFNNYVGMKYEEAVQAAKADGGITVKIDANGTFSDTAEPGVVVSQEPKAGSPVNGADPIVCLVLSNGPEKITLPACEKKGLTTVADSLTGMGLIVLQEAEYSDTVESGYVIAYKDHSAGDKVDNGSEVILRVSKGVEPTE